MSTGESLVVVFAVDSDVTFDVLAELVTDLVEGLLFAASPHDSVGEVGMHTCAVPVTWNWFWVEVQGDVVLFAQTVHEVTRDPDFVSRSLSTLVEDLVLPRSKHDFGVGSFDVESSIDANVQMLIHDVSATDVSGANTTIVWSLWGREESLLWPSDWVASGVVDQDVLLFKAEPKVIIVVIDFSSSVGSMRSSIRVQDLAHDDECISAAWVGADVDWFEETV